MAWSHLQYCSANNAGGANITATFSTANLSAGTKLIFVGYGGGGANGAQVTAVSDGTNSFSQIVSSTFVYANVELSIWVLDTPAGDVGTKPTITATFVAGVGGYGMICMELSGLATGSTLAACVDGTPGVGGSSTAATSYSFATYTDTVVNEFLLEIIGDGGIGT